MRQKLTIIVLLTLLTRLAYSQTVLIDKAGDTTICITIPQMDRVYIELLQKDSLSEQAILSHARELLLYEVIDSVKSDIKLLEQLVYTIDSENMGLHLDNKNKTVKLKRSRFVAIIASLIATLIIIR